jgi:MSHA biogenesis protein MshI
MNLHWPVFGAGAQGWTAFDAADGACYAASVRASPNAGGKHQVVACARSTGQSVQAIRDLAAKAGASGYPATLVLARGEYQMLVVPEPPVLDSEMQQSLHWSLAPLIEFPADESTIAWMRIPTAQYEPTHEKNVYAIVSRRSVVDAHAALFAQAGVALKAVEVRETALRNIAVLIEKKRGEGLGLLTVGPTGVATTFTFRGELYLDRFIAQPMDEIFAGDDQRRQKFFDRVSQQVYQSMELIARTHPFIAIERIVLGPLPAPLDLVASLAGKLPVPVQTLDLSSVFDLSATPQLQKQENQAAYLVALGAALRGVRQVK